MNARSLHPAKGRNAAPGRVHDDTTGTREAVPPGMACCCPARPVARIVMPPTASELDTCLATCDLAGWVG